jgi:hypothetical protein
MNSSNVGQVRARRFWAGAACASVVLGFVACSGSSEHDSPRSDCPYSDNAAGEASAGQGHTNSQAGKGGQGGTVTPVEGGAGGVPANDTNLGGDTGVAGTTGETASGGQASGGETNEGAGGQTAGGEANGGAGGEGPVVPVDAICGANMAQVGAYSLWCGKVNMHKNAQGVWVHDADCTSGCNIYGVDYCKKFYPNATAVVAVDQTASVVKDWKNAGCAESSPDGKGISGEAVCCAPLP